MHARQDARPRFRDSSCARSLPRSMAPSKTQHKQPCARARHLRLGHLHRCFLLPVSSLAEVLVLVGCVEILRRASSANRQPWICVAAITAFGRKSMNTADSDSPYLGFPCCSACWRFAHALCWHGAGPIGSPLAQCRSFPVLGIRLFSSGSFEIRVAAAMALRVRIASVLSRKF